MSIVVYQDVATPVVPIEGLAGRVREALGDALRSMRYVTPDFAGLYQDAAGTTPVTSVGQPVGLMLDRRFGLARGAELFTSFDVVQPGWVSLGGGRYSIAGAAAQTDLRATGHIVPVIGKHYEWTITLSGVSGPTPIGFFFSGSQKSGLTNGVHKFLVRADSGVVIFRAYTGTSCIIESISVREIPGSHASQATTTARPALRSGPLRIDYDGVDDYLRTVFPALGSNVTIARSIPGVGAQILTGQTIAAGNWDDNVDSCATLVIDRALTGPETALVTALLNQQAGV